MALPLDGLRVVDLTRDFAGPFCTMILGDLGAEIVKVEKPGMGDETRAWGPPFVKGTSYYFFSLNRGKKSVALDLRNPEAQRAIRKLIADSDIFVESNRPGVLAKYHLDYPSLRKINHSLVYCSISGFGQTGPYRDRPGYDIVAFAMSGIMNSTGSHGRPPVRVSVPVADLAAGHYATTAILAALSKRLVTGQGDYVDLSLYDSIVSWLSYLSSYYFITGVEPKKMGSAHPSIVPYQAFKCKDKELIVAVGNDAQWSALCIVLGDLMLQDDERFATNPARVKNRDILIPLLSKRFREEDTAYWQRLFIATGVPCSPIYSVSDVSKDKQLRFRRMLKKSDLGIPQLSSPMKFSRYKTRAEGRTHVPELGEHTRQILTWLGYTQRERAKITEGFTRNNETRQASIR